MGTYNTPTEHRLAYDDGGLGCQPYLGLQTGSVNSISPNSLSGLNNDSAANVYDMGRDFSGYTTVAWVWPEPIDLAGYLVSTSFFSHGNPNYLHDYYWSTDTTDGTDGTWTYGGSKTLTHFQDATDATRRNNMTALALAGIKGFRMRFRQGTNFSNLHLQEVNLWGAPSAATGPRLDFWDPTENQRLGPDGLDFDDIPRCQWQPRPFRIHNSSPDTEATGITVGRNALNPGSPSILESLLFSTDQITWSTSVTIEDLPAGATSPKIWVVSAVPSNGPTGLRWARAYVDCNEFDRSHHYAYWYVVDTAAPEPGRLIRVTPNVGSEGETVEIMGIGLGTTQGRWSAIPRINDIAMTVTSWTNVAETSGASDGFLDETADDTNLEHQLIEVTVPPGAETGVITVDVDDGT